MPFIGDLVGMLASSYIVAQAARLGASKSVLARMALNIAVEGLVGAIPFAGDLFDAGWKANQRNVRLLSAWLDTPAKAEKGSRTLVIVVFAVLLAVALLILSLTLLALRWLVDSAT